jgi:hypothetical protein
MRRIAIAAGILLAWQAARLCANPLALLMPSAGDVVKLIDALTKKDSPTDVDVKLGKTAGQGKLLVARTKVDVAMERTSRNWRGKVRVQMKVPTEITYAIDLTRIRPGDVRVDASKRAVVVRMPPPTVEDVTPDLPAVTHESGYRAARFRLLDRDTSRELQNAMLLHDYQAKARAAGDAAAAKVRPQDREALRQLLRTLLRGTAPGVDVIVE